LIQLVRASRRVTISIARQGRGALRSRCRPLTRGPRRSNPTSHPLRRYARPATRRLPGAGAPACRPWSDRGSSTVLARAGTHEGLALRLFDARQSVRSARRRRRARRRRAPRARGRARRGSGCGLMRRFVGAVARFDKGSKRLLDSPRAVFGAMRDVTLALIATETSPCGGASHRGEECVGPRVLFTGELRGAARLLLAFDIYASPSHRKGLPTMAGGLEARALASRWSPATFQAHASSWARRRWLVAGGVDHGTDALQARERRRRAARGTGRGEPPALGASSTRGQLLGALGGQCTLRCCDGLVYRLS